MIVNKNEIEVIFDCHLGSLIVETFESYTLIYLLYHNQNEFRQTLDMPEHPAACHEARFFTRTKTFREPAGMARGRWQYAALLSPCQHRPWLFSE